MVECVFLLSVFWSLKGIIAKFLPLETYKPVSTYPPKVPMRNLDIILLKYMLEDPLIYWASLQSIDGGLFIWLLAILSQQATL